VVVMETLPLELEVQRLSAENLILSNQVKLKTDEIIKLSNKIKSLNYDLTVTEQELADLIIEIHNANRMKQ